MPRVSICISTFNRIDDLRRCVKSVLEQTFTDWELVIVDNASRDHTVEYLYHLGNLLGDRLIYYRMPHSNFTAMQTLNKSFKMANGEFIVVLDDDAWMERHCLQFLYDDIISEPDMAIVGAGVRGLDDEIQMHIRNVNGQKIKLDGSILYFDFKGACALMRKSDIAKFDFYDETFNIYMNELDLSLKCLKDNKLVIIDSDAIAYHKGSVDVGNPSRYLSNYDEVIYRNFNKINGIKCILLNYFMISWMKGQWLTNLWITLVYLMKIIFRFSYVECPKFVQYTLLNGMINSIKEHL